MQRKSIEERFWAKVDKSGECWLWTGGAAGRGYGVMTLGYKADHDRRMVYVHRLSYEMAFGPIADGMDVCHRCDTPRCVRPSHLFAGTRSDNMKDARDKGRGKWPVGQGENAPAARLTAADVAEIRRLGNDIPKGRGRNTGGRYRPKHLTQEMLAIQFGVSDSMIGNILRGEAWHLSPP